VPSCGENGREFLQYFTSTSLMKEKTGKLNSEHTSCSQKRLIRLIHDNDEDGNTQQDF
jgi:hypothetical protein